MREIGMMPTMRLTLAIILAVLAGPVTAQQTVAAGSLLVASPALADPNFMRSVVLVLRHDDMGTIGVAINRATSLSPVKVFPEFSPALDGYMGTLYRGGPVGPARVLFLITGLAAAVVQGPELLDDLYVSVDPDQLPEFAALAEGPDGLRLYAGHAEWEAGQLQEEIADGSWRVIPGNVDLVFGEAAAIWEQAARLDAEVVVDARAP
jgi:putative transcriptional regulator